ncbi:MAG: hypothetical protein MI807_05590 [Verrucomicrobiales bacterium]|nr:hypothetical protein [Verrucomicrobiales bacterium]
MRISFQTICLLVAVTLAHFAIVAGVTRIGEGPAEFLSAVDGEAILEGLLEERESVQEEMTGEEQHPVEGGGSFPAVEEGVATGGHPLFSKPGNESEGEGSAEPDKIGKLEGEGVTAETEEYSAFIDARLLAGRVESPDPDRYFRDAPARKRKENEADVDADRDPVEPEPAEKKDIAPPKETSAVGPHKIRPISG